MRERSLVAFTVLGQAAAGMVAVLMAVRVSVGPEADAWLPVPLLVAGALIGLAAAAAVPHLGRPRAAWRVLRGVGSSWLSRELLTLAVFGAGWLGLVALYATGVGGAALRAGVLLVVTAAAVALVYAMARVYRLRTVPPWDSPLTTLSFFLTALVLGALTTAVAVALAGQGSGWDPSLRGLALAAAWGLLAELLVGPVMRRHVRRARARVDPGLWPARGGGRAGLLPGRTLLRWLALLSCLSAAAMATVGAGPIGTAPVPPLLIVALAAAVPPELTGRAAFYASFARRGM